MQIVHCQRKGDHLNTIERFHIHTEFAANSHLNDPQTIFPNAILNTLTKAHQPSIDPSYSPPHSPRQKNGPEYSAPPST